jgi:hypothetical protein
MLRNSLIRPNNKDKFTANNYTRELSKTSTRSLLIEYLMVSSFLSPAK